MPNEMKVLLVEKKKWELIMQRAEDKVEAINFKLDQFLEDEIISA